MEQKYPNETARWIPHYPDAAWRIGGMADYYVCSGCWKKIGPNERSTRCPFCDRKMSHRVLILYE